MWRERPHPIGIRSPRQVCGVQITKILNCDASRYREWLTGIFYSPAGRVARPDGFAEGRGLLIGRDNLESPVCHARRGLRACHTHEVASGATQRGARYLATSCQNVVDAGWPWADENLVLTQAGDQAEIVSEQPGRQPASPVEDAGSRNKCHLIRSPQKPCATQIFISTGLPREVVMD